MSSGDPGKYDDAPGSLARFRALLLQFPSIGRLLRLPREINRLHRVPYLAGSSADGRIVYIDSGLPMEIGKPPIPIDKYLEVHEAAEYALRTAALGEPRLKRYREYEASHHLATAAEQCALISDGYSWPDYRGGLEPFYAPTEGKKLVNIPPDLAEYPYSGRLLDRLRAAKAKSHFSPEEVHYLPRSPTRRDCDDCGMFLPRLRRCTWVAGPIEPEGVCDKFEPKEPSHAP